jgi:hypothetical protein
MPNNGRSVTGLHIHPSNVRCYIPGILRSIQPGFWRDQPEIDPNLWAWIEALNARRKSPRAPARVVMFPAAKRTSRLQLVRSEPDDEHFPPESA